MANKVKKLTNKITFKEQDDFHTVVISPTIERWQLGSLFVWLLAWTACGGVFVYYLAVGGLTQNEFLVLLVLLVFWLYFEIRIFRAFLWRKFGLEIIRIDSNELSIKDSIFLYGKPTLYNLNGIQLEEIQNIHQNPKSFGKVMNDSFWQIGQGTVTFRYKEKDVFFGTQLENQDSHQLVKLIKKLVKKYQGDANPLMDIEGD